MWVFPQANIALFEARCKEKIQQFEDAGSDEEDIWDEKDVTFAPESQRRPRWATQTHKDVSLFNVKLKCASVVTSSIIRHQPSTLNTTFKLSLKPTVIPKCKDLKGPDQDNKYEHFL